MTIQEWLSAAHEQLKRADIATARLDLLVLLSDELEHDKSWVLGHPEHILQGSEIDILNTKIAQRVHHTPLAYIRGKAEFYGREFIVNKYVLVPRPESEAMIDLLKMATSLAHNITVVDIGTGSGALAITAVLELPGARVIATDIDAGPLAVATENAEHLHAVISFLRGDLLRPFFDSGKNIADSVLLANLPYVPDTYPINQAAKHEPDLALFGGHDGLELYRRLCTQLAQLEAKPAYIITESMEDEHASLAELMNTAGYKQHDSDGLAQCFKIDTPS
jgi:release factor glutamine methyltransferase